jgi:hypothetical protein
MAATPKPVREKQKKMMAMQKAHRISEGKIIPKSESRARLKEHKEKHGTSTHDINMSKRSRPVSKKHSKKDLSEAHKHMKEHGG